MNIDKLSFKEIKKIIDEKKYENEEEFLMELKGDRRKTVNKLANKIEKEILNKKLLQEKFENMKKYEKKFWDQNLVVAGIDEVGRGPLFGPVVSAVVILPKDNKLIGIDDSKKISEIKRKELYQKILEECIEYSIGIADNNEIDGINILNATKLSMERAIKSLNKTVDHLLIDALTLENVDIDQTPIIKGDSKSISIAAASIIAKVTRDTMIEEIAKEYKEYDLDKNKGYGTKKHYEAIKKYGITKFHRKSFLKNLSEH